MKTLVSKVGLYALSLNRMTHGAAQQRAVQTALDEVVLSAGLNGLERRGFVIAAGDDDDGEVGCGSREVSHGVDAVGVRQRQVQEHAARTRAGQVLDSVGDGLAVKQLKPP